MLILENLIRTHSERKERYIANADTDESWRLGVRIKINVQIALFIPFFQEITQLSI